MGASVFWYEPVNLTLQDAVSASANGTVFLLNGKYSAVTLQTKGTFVATVNFEASNDDGTTWKAIQGMDINAGTVATSTSTATIILLNVAGIQRFRARVVWSSGTSVTVLATASPAPVGPLSVNVVQSTHDNFNANANIQVGNADVTEDNPVPVDLIGSNTRQWASDTILIGTGAAHSAGDVVSTDAGEILQFDVSDKLDAGGSGIILSSLVTLDNNAVFSSGAGYDLHIYSTSPTAQATNAVFNMTTGDMAKYIGKITIGTLVDLGDTCAKTDIGHNLDFTLSGAETTLYGKLVCIGGETTVSAKTITINLGIAAL